MTKAIYGGNWGFADSDPVDISEIPETKALSNPDSPVYTAEFKVRVALQYLLTCSLSKTCEKMGIDKHRFFDWMRSDWWPTAVRAARQSFSAEITGSYSEIVQQALVQLQDRLMNGDVVGETVDKETGEVVAIRRPVKAKELAIISAIGFDKRQIATGQPTSVKRTYITAAERADRLRGAGTESYYQNQGESGNVTPIRGKVA